MKNLGSIHKGALVVACSVGLIQHAVAQVGGTANVSPPTSPGASSTTTVTVVSQESQSSPDVKLATSSAPGAVGIASNSTTDRWNQWLAAEGNKAVGHPYAEGVNSLRDGRIIVFQSGEAECEPLRGTQDSSAPETLRSTKQN